MKKIIGYLRDFHTHEFRLGMYLILGGLLILCTVLNYTLDLEDHWINALRGKPVQILAYLGWYGLPYFGALCLWSAYSGQRDFWGKPGFWVMSLLGLVLLSVDGWFVLYRDLAKQWFTPETRVFGMKILWNLKRYFLYGITLFLFWKLVDRKQESFYGFTTRNFDARPYFLMLLIVLPGVVGFSFTEDFMAAYPSYKPGTAEAYWKVSPAVTVGTFELVYGLDFAMVEMMFRGFLVIGLAQYLGRGAVFPMVAAYCFLHFGKPAGEAISSIFGGYILGIAALYSRSIWGGVIAHMGLAWMMEFCSILQHVMRGDWSH